MRSASRAGRAEVWLALRRLQQTGKLRLPELCLLVVYFITNRTASHEPAQVVPHFFVCLFSRVLDRPSRQVLVQRQESEKHGVSTSLWVRGELSIVCIRVRACCGCGVHFFAVQLRYYCGSMPHSGLPRNLYLSNHGPIRDAYSEICSKLRHPVAHILLHSNMYKILLYLYCTINSIHMSTDTVLLYIVRRWRLRMPLCTYVNSFQSFFAYKKSTSPKPMRTILLHPWRDHTLQTPDCKHAL